MNRIGPLEFFSHLKWIDGRPLLDTIEEYRRRIFEEVLYTFDGNRPRYNLALLGRAKKNWKTADLVLAALYRFVAWESGHGNDCFILANDEGQAADDLKLLKRVVAVNPEIKCDVRVKDKEIVRLDGAGALQILPAKDVIGLHGKSSLFTGFDEIHGMRDWSVFEALAPDPTRLDTLQWITSYASIYNSPGVPLFDLIGAGKRGEDPRMFFSWYAGDYTTDRALDSAEPEARANPSMASWGNDGYLAQQRRRLPTHKYRRLHLNLPGMPEGAFFNPARVMDCIVPGRRVLPPQAGREYVGWVDMSGGSADDATLGIAHKDGSKAVLDLVMNQGARPPFNPRSAVTKFAAMLTHYGLRAVHGDAYAGETFRRDFEALGLTYRVEDLSASEIYEDLEPKINAGEVELLDVAELTEQLLCLVVKGAKVTHPAGEHDDWANAAAGACAFITRSESHLGFLQYAKREFEKLQAEEVSAARIGPGGQPVRNLGDPAPKVRNIFQLRPGAKPRGPQPARPLTVAERDMLIEGKPS